MTDPDDDAVRESDVEICDNVNAYFTLTMDKKNQDIFFGAVNMIMNKTEDMEHRDKCLYLVHAAIAMGEPLTEIMDKIKANLK